VTGFQRLQADVGDLDLACVEAPRSDREAYLPGVEGNRELRADGGAGDLAESAVGQVAMTATDVVARLGEALNRLTGAEKDA